MESDLPYRISLDLVPAGWLSADLHVHGRASFDSGIPDDDRVRLGPGSALNMKRPDSSVPITATRRGTAPRIQSRSQTSMPASAMALSPGIVSRPRIGIVPPK